MVADSNQPSCLRWIPAFEAVAKNIKALNHEEHEGHKGKEKLFFVLFVVPPSFQGLLRPPPFTGMTESTNITQALSLKTPIRSENPA